MGSCDGHGMAVLTSNARASSSPIEPFHARCRMSSLCHLGLAALLADVVEVAVVAAALQL